MLWTALTAHRAQLGEGPFWDAPGQALYWVDIAGRQALRLCGERLQAWQLPEPVSAFIPCERGDALVTLSSGVYRLDLGSAPAAPRLSLLCVADPQPGNRANEARCDAQGRLWLGTMQNNIGEQGEDLPVRRRSGGLFRIDAQARVTPLLQGLGIPNTLLWNEDGSRLYFADSLDGTLYQYPIASDGRLEPARSWFGPHPRRSGRFGDGRPGLYLECPLGRRLPAQAGARRRGRPGARTAGQPPHQLRVRRRGPQDPVHHQRGQPARSSSGRRGAGCPGRYPWEPLSSICRLRFQAETSVQRAVCNEL